MAATTGDGWSKTASSYGPFEEFTGGFARDALDMAIAASPVAAGTGPVSVIEIAAGTGAGTVRTIEALCATNAEREVHLLATDISEGMLEKLRQKVDGLVSTYPNLKLETRVADMQQLSSVPNAAFDVLTCFFGVMFPPDPLAALREMRRVLKVGGIGAVTTWHLVNMEEALAPTAVKQGFAKTEEEFSFGFKHFGQLRSMHHLLRKAGWLVGTDLGSKEMKGEGNAICRFVTRPPTLLPVSMVVATLKTNPVFVQLGNWDIEAAEADLKANWASAEPGFEDCFAGQGTALITLLRGHHCE